MVTGEINKRRGLEKPSGVDPKNHFRKWTPQPLIPSYAIEYTYNNNRMLVKLGLRLEASDLTPQLDKIASSFAQPQKAMQSMPINQNYLLYVTYRGKKIKRPSM